jgi:hypothetical protein
MMLCELNKKQRNVKSAIFILNCFFQPQGGKPFQISAIKFGKLFCSKFNSNQHKHKKVSGPAEQLNNLQCTECQAMAYVLGILLFTVTS